MFSLAVGGAKSIASHIRPDAPLNGVMCFSRRECSRQGNPPNTNCFQLPANI